MTKQMIITLLTILGISISSLSAEAQETDQERIQGTWEIVSFIQSGEADEDEDQVGHHFLFEGNRIFLEEEGSEEMQISFELDESAMPALFDMSITIDLGREGPPITMSTMGIYELEGDTLTLCFTGEGSEKRPTEFESPADSDVVLIQFKRVVEEE